MATGGQGLTGASHACEIGSGYVRLNSHKHYNDSYDELQLIALYVCAYIH